MTEPITVDDYKLVSDEFFQKYDFVKERMQLGAKAEDILKVMEAVGGVALRFALEEKEGPFGFNKNGKDNDGAEKTDTSINAGS